MSRKTKTYIVRRTYTIICDAEVNAPSQQEAIRLAEEGAVYFDLDVDRSKGPDKFKVVSSATTT